MRNGVKVGIVGGVFAVMVGGAGYGAYNIVSAVSGDGGSAAAGAEKTGPPSDDEVAETSEKFFTAWEQGDAATAADLTDNALAAKELLIAYGGQAHIGKVKITPGTATGATVPFEVSATVSYEGRSKPLTYKSEPASYAGRPPGGRSSTGGPPSCTRISRPATPCSRARRRARPSRRWTVTAPC